MKRAILVVLMTAALVVPVFGQVRLDLGFDVPMTVGAISAGGVEVSGEAGEFLRNHVLPFPELSLGYQFKAGPFSITPGVRAFTVVLLSVMWPNISTELQLGPVFFQVQVGGLAFAVFGLVNQADFGKVLLPDLSVWFGLGKERRFRLGGGVLGMLVPELTSDAMLIVPYLGGKVALTF